MKELFYYSIFAIVLYFVLTAIFDNFNLEQENFDPSLVPVSSIVTLAKVAQKLVNGNGTLTNPGSLTVTGLLTANTNLNVIGSGNFGVGDIRIVNAGNEKMKPAVKLGSNLYLGEYETTACDVVHSSSSTGLLLNAKSENVRVWSSNFNVDKNLTVSGNSTVTGSVDATGHSFHDRSNRNNRFEWYSNGGTARLWYNAVDDKNKVANSKHNENIFNIDYFGNTNVTGTLSVNNGANITGNTTITGNINARTNSHNTRIGGIWTSPGIYAEGYREGDTDKTRDLEIGASSTNVFIGRNDSTVPNNLTVTGNSTVKGTLFMSNDRWQKSNDNKNRLHFTSNAETIYGSGNGNHYFRTGADANAPDGMVLNSSGNLTVNGTVFSRFAKFRLKSNNGWYLYAEGNEVRTYIELDDDRFYWYWNGSRLFNVSTGNCLTSKDEDLGRAYLAPFDLKNKLQYFKEFDDGGLIPHVFKGNDNNTASLYVHGDYGSVLVYHSRVTDSRGIFFKR